MTKVTKFPDGTLGWQREPGPVRVWRLVDGRKKTADGKTLRFSIQEVPEDRYEDVMDLMCMEFVREEPMCSFSNVVDDVAAMEDFRKVWSFSLQKGITVGAFLVDENNPKPVLAGVNMTLVECKDTEKAMQAGIEFGSNLSLKILGVLHEMEAEKNAREVYNVDKFMTAYGLCVHPQYRGQGLGVQLLEARNDMSVAYDIPATTTVFTAPIAQELAAQAGFEVLLERDYVDLKNADGNELFPGIPQKSIKYMGKRFSN